MPLATTVRATLICGILLCACSNNAPPFFAPPPFGPDPDRPEAARFFFPTGIVVASEPPAGGGDPVATWVLVSNSNADRQYDAGALYSFRAADLLQYFQPGPPAGIVPFPNASLVGKVITGNFTGPMILAGGTAYTGSRDTNRVNALSLDKTTGELRCHGIPGIDCRGDSIDLKNAAQLEGPFGIVAAPFRKPGATQDVPAVLVTSLIPFLDDIQSGVILSRSRLVGLDQADPTQILFAATVTDRQTGGFAGGPMVYDDRAREAIIAGCYSRYTAASAGGEASTIKCGALASGQNLLRFVPVDAGSAARARIYDLGTQVHSVDSTGLALGAIDPVTGLRHLYMTTRLSDGVVRIGIPADPAFVPVVEAVVPTSSQPSQVVRLQRPTGSTGPDLLAVTALATYETSTRAGKLLVVDGMLGRVVGQVELHPEPKNATDPPDLGDSPFGIAQFPPAAGDPSARLAITMFGSCSVALVDVPYDDPSRSSLRASLGSCPQ